MDAILYKDPTSGFSWLDFGSKPDPETIASLKANGWRWGPYRKQWYTNRRWPTMPQGVTVEDGGTVDYSAERADRLADRANKATEASNAAYARSSTIAGMIPLGQPILVGHHSEGRHRRDLDKISRAMDESVAQYRRAEHLQSAARSSAAHQAAKESPAVIARRIERLKAEKTAMVNQYRPLDYRTYRPIKGSEPKLTPDAQQKADWYDQQIAENEALLAEVGGLPVSVDAIKPGDIVMYRGRRILVKKVNKKTIVGDDLHFKAANEHPYFWQDRKCDLTFVTRIVQPAEDQA